MAKSFNELSTRTQLLIFVFICGLAVAGAWQLIIGPKRAELETLQSRLTQVDGEVARVQAVAGKLPVIQREVRALEVALRETTAIIPDEKDPQDVLRNLHELASESALDIASFLPKPVVAKAQYSEWPIQLGLEGTYHDLGRFFDRIATMSRLISVSELEVKTRTRTTGKGSIEVKCLATTFVFKKDPVPTAPAAPGGRP
jgi:type IV pilus assembly protein PilO